MNILAFLDILRAYFFYILKKDFFRPTHPLNLENSRFVFFWTLPLGMKKDLFLLEDLELIIDIDFKHSRSF